MNFFRSHINTSLFLSFILILFININSIAQSTHVLTLQPEQDACNALLLCGNNFTTPYSYDGIGKKNDLDQTPCFNSPGGGEANSVWLRVNVAVSGRIVFQIQPINHDDDYDFAVLKVPASTCNNLNTGNVIRCNFNSNLPGSNVNGIVGLNTSSNIPFVQGGAIGSSFCSPVDVFAGDSYLIMINNYGNYNNPGPSSGFTIDFTGSTASFNNGEKPEIKNLSAPCLNQTTVTVNLSTQILCSSIAPDGSDFSINAPAKIISASGVNCTNNTGYTNTVTINLASPLSPGNYTLQAQKGSDGNTLLSICNNALALPSTTNFTITTTGIQTYTDQTICYDQLPYTWNNIIVASGGNAAASYKTKSEAGCDSTAILNLTVLPPPAQLSESHTICNGDSYLLPWDSAVTTSGIYTYHYNNIAGCDSLMQTINITVDSPHQQTIATGFCVDQSVLLNGGNEFINYIWNTGAKSNSISVNTSGTYTLIATDALGCVAKDTFSVTAYSNPVAAFNATEMLCGTNSKVLDAGPGLKNYQWNNGNTTQTIIVNSAGKYWVGLIDNNNCSATDTTNVIAVPIPVNFLTPEITKCFYADIYVAPISLFSEYQWSNGTTIRNVKISTGGEYLLEVTDNNGCIGKDSINIIDSACQEYLYIPTAFTPNNDGRNDLFKPKFEGKLIKYRFTIYDRWGKKVFVSSNATEGWNGYLNSSPQQPGTYVWTCEYALLNQTPKIEKGTVTLIR